MTDLARSFADVADAYERGPPRLWRPQRSPRSPPRPAAVRACSTSAPGPASSRRAAAPGLRRRGRRAARRHARHPRRPHRRRAGAGGPRRGAAAGRRDRRRRGLQRRVPLVRRRPAPADELARVVRPGGGVVVCVTHPRWLGSDAAPDWWLDLGAVHAALPKRRPSVPDGLAAPRRPRGGIRPSRRSRSATSPSCTPPTATGIVAHCGARCPSSPRSRPSSGRCFLSERRRDAGAARRRPGRAALPAPSCGSLGGGSAERGLGGRRAAAS